MNPDIESERDITATVPTVPALKCVTEHWYGRVYTGTREALVATGMVEPDWFPGEPGRPKTSVTLRLDDGRNVNLQKRSARLFDLTWPWTDDERAAREHGRRQREAFDNLRAHVRQLPDCAADYRDETLHRLRCLSEETAIDLCRRRGGYRFDEASRRAIAHAFGELARAVANAVITFDPAARNGEVASIYDRHAQGIPQDDAFERFLHAAVAAGPIAGDAPDD